MSITMNFTATNSSNATITLKMTPEERVQFEEIFFKSKKEELQETLQEIAKKAFIKELAIFERIAHQFPYGLNILSHLKNGDSPHAHEGITRYVEGMIDFIDQLDYELFEDSSLLKHKFVQLFERKMNELFDAYYRVAQGNPKDKTAKEYDA